MNKAVHKFDRDARHKAGMTAQIGAGGGVLSGLCHLLLRFALSRAGCPTASRTTAAPDFAAAAGTATVAACAGTDRIGAAQSIAEGFC